MQEHHNKTSFNKENESEKVPPPPTAISSSDRKPKKDKRFKHNWRIDMLAVPKGHPELLEMFRMSPKERAEFRKTLSESSLHKKKSRPKVPLEEDRLRMKRLQELSVKMPRFYGQQKKLYAPLLGQTFSNRMDENIQIYNNSIYNEYSRAKLKMKEMMMKKKSHSSLRSHGSNKSSKSGKSKKGVSQKGDKLKKSQSAMLKEMLQYIAGLAKPKKVHPPMKIDRGKRGNIDALLIRLHKLSTPKHFYIRPSQTTMYNINKVSGAALAYKITERVLELARPVHRRYHEDLIPGAVVPEALKAKATPRLEQLAVPKARANVGDSDYNENAFKISPNALKYKPTQRVLELSKPLERNN